jgi:hypothetical protein
VFGVGAGHGSAQSTRGYVSDLVNSEVDKALRLFGRRGQPSSPHWHRVTSDSSTETNVFV